MVVGEGVYHTTRSLPGFPPNNEICVLVIDFHVREWVGWGWGERGGGRASVGKHCHTIKHFKGKPYHYKPVVV